jgi:hypothetical protein
MSRRALRRTLVACAGVTSVLVGLGVVMLRPASLKAEAERRLSERLGLEVVIGDLRVSWFPRPRVSGTDVVARVPGAGDAEPFVVIDRFSADVGPFSVWRRHVSALDVEGLRINVPAGVDVPDRPAGEHTTSAGTIAGRLTAHDAVLTILRRDPSKTPLVFRIHRLDVVDVGFDAPMAFTLDMTNPVPEGRVESTGSIGPWNRANPAKLPVSGGYSFSLAKLGPLRGIGGTLTSVGQYTGDLTAIAVTGTTSTPDFSLDMNGTPLPLTASFQATVDGTDGSTTIDRVDAMLVKTPIVARGRVDNLPGPGNRHIDLTADISNGRIEDVLRLAVDADEPALAGRLLLSSHIVLPPGHDKVRDRLRIDGSFQLAEALFSSGIVQAKVDELSRRSQGMRKDDPDLQSRTATSLSGAFAMAGGRIELQGVAFQVPGADVRLTGTYGVVTSEIDLAGSLRMRATVSKAVGGVRSIFLKPFDWIFRQDGAGAVVPIAIGGTPQKPTFGLRRGASKARARSGA